MNYRGGKGGRKKSRRGGGKRGDCRRAREGEVQKQNSAGKREEKGSLPLRGGKRLLAQGGGKKKEGRRVWG